MDKIKGNANKNNSLFITHAPIILFDTETTGLFPGSDEIIELGAIALVRGTGNAIIREELNCLIKLPEGKSLSAEITKITGITEEMLEAQGVTQQEAAGRFMEAVKILTKTLPKNDTRRVLFIAHNAHFDMGFLNAFLRKNQHGLTAQFDVLDTLTVLKDRKPYPHKLSDAITHYNLDNEAENSHRALDDVKALYAVLSAMAKEAGDLHKYINLLGYNPKYGVEGEPVSERARYKPQPFNSPVKLYEECS
jgi:DNA polymerase III epsilon subunit-like protein